MHSDDISIPKDIIRFAGVLITFIVKKVVFMAKMLTGSIFALFSLLSYIQSRLVFRLLWRRGALTRPASHVSLIGFTLSLLSLASIIGSSGVLGNTNLNSSLPTLLESGFLLEPMTTDTEIPSSRGRDETIIYTVKSGDTLFSIAQEFNVSLDTISYVNNVSDNDYLSVGQKLDILPVSGINYTVKAGDTLEKIADKYKSDAQAIYETNWLEDQNLEVGQKLVIPGATPPQPVVPVVPRYAQGPVVAPSGPVASTGQFTLPVAGGKTRGYGWYYGYFHGADDFGASCGTVIVAADSGYVEYAGWHAGGWGNTVWLDHGNGYKTRYAHMTAVVASTGQSVGKSQVIGYVGQTGLAYGCHLHFEVLQNGAQINPDSVL